MVSPRNFLLFSLVDVPAQVRKQKEKLPRGKADDWKGKWDLRVAHKGFIICDSRILSFPTISPTFGRPRIHFHVGISFVFPSLRHRVGNRRSHKRNSSNVEMNSDGKDFFWLYIFF